MRGNKLKYIIGTLLLTLMILGVYSCKNDYQPKPRGYFRIELPVKKYHRFEISSFPYEFDIPVYTKIAKPQSNPEKYWINIVYPMFKAQLHISYKPVRNNLDTLLYDAHKMMNKHIPKANAINEQMFLNDDLRVYGMAYEIKGTEAASPYQFYLTDSTNHFLRGALYFNFSPNNDSLMPVIDFIQEDMERLIESFEWNSPSPE